MFDLQALRELIAADLETRGFRQVVWVDSPVESTTTDQSFAFSDPVPGPPTAASSAGSVRPYAWDLRFVWVVAPSSDASALAGAQAVAVAIDALRFRANWPANLVGLSFRPATAPRREQTPEAPQVLVLTWRVTASVYEAAPV